MKRFLILSFLLYYSVSLFSQSELEPQDIGWRGWRGKNVELHTISDKENTQHCLFLVGADSIKGFLLNNSGAIVHTYTISRVGSEKLMGGFIKDGKIYVYLHNSSDEVFHALVFEGDTDKENVIPFPLKKEKQLDKISCGDHFIYFTVNKKSSDLIIYDFKDEMKYDTLRYHFEDDLWKKLTKGNSNFGRDADVGTVDPQGKWSVESAQNANKIYYVHDSLFLVMNNERGNTGVIAFDMQHKQTSTWVVTQSDAVMPADDRPHPYSDNSFLLDGKLYYVQATFDSLFVQVNDFYGGQLLKKYTSKRNEDIDFKNTPIMQGGTALYAKGAKELDKTRQLLRKMVNGRAMIVARREGSGRVVLTIGSYTEAGGGGGFMMGGGAGGAGGAPVFMGGGGGPGWTVSARFKMLLDENTFEHVGGDIGPGIYEKVDSFTSDKNVPENGEAVFMLGNDYVYAYYDKTASMLRMVRM